MSDLIVSSDIDAFLQAANKAAARDAIETLGGSLGSTDNAVLRADGAGGKTAQGSGVTIPDGATGALGNVVQTFSNADVTVTPGTTLLVQTGTLSAARTITLPAASAYPAGSELRIEDASGTATITNTLTCVGAGGDTVHALPIRIPRGTIRLVSDGVSTWRTAGGRSLQSLDCAEINNGGAHVTGTIGSSSRYFAYAYVWILDSASVIIGALAQSGDSAYASTTDLRWSATTNQHATKDLGLSRAAAGVLGITDGATGGGALEMVQVASLGTPGTNSARLGVLDVAGTAEVHVVDEAGNVTQISAHTGSAPEWMYRDGQPDHSEAIGVSWNNYTGIVTYHHRETGAIYRETFGEHNERLGLTGERALVLRNWDTDQASNASSRAAEQAQWDARRAQWEAQPEPRPEWTGGDRPEDYVAKPRPPGLTDQTASVLAGRAREAARAALRARWAEQPAWIRGPFAEKFSAAQSLLDDGDDDAAEALIRYADAPSGYDADQLAAFATLKAELADAIAALPS